MSGPADPSRELPRRRRIHRWILILRFIVEGCLVATGGYHIVAVVHDRFLAGRTEPLTPNAKPLPPDTEKTQFAPRGSPTAPLRLKLELETGELRVTLPAEPAVRSTCQ